MRAIYDSHPSGSDQAVWSLEEGMKTATRTQGRCRVCGFTEIRTDEVIDHGVVFLAECPRCEYRWTSNEPPVEVRSIGRLRPAVRYQRVPARVAWEVPAA